MFSSKKEIENPNYREWTQKIAQCGHLKSLNFNNPHSFGYDDLTKLQLNTHYLHGILTGSKNIGQNLVELVCDKFDLS